MSNVINAEEPVINGKYKSLSDSIMAIEASRFNIINSINNSLPQYDLTKLSNEEYIDPNRLKYVNSENAMQDIIDNTTSLLDIPDEISSISYWKPVMQIARSARGDGTINIEKGTATTITMYNNEVSSSFFTEEDVSTDENNIPLCYWGYGIDSSTPQVQNQNIAPNSRIFNRYSTKNQDSLTRKRGYLFPVPGNALANHGTIYYQFTFPYDCYVCITIVGQMNWNNVEGSGEPKAFIITDEYNNDIVARTTYDDGNGNNDSIKNRYFSTIYWHGYVKKGWKFYYAEQDSYIDSAYTWAPQGHCCLVFKVGQNTSYISNSTESVYFQPILSMYRTGNNQQHTSKETGTAINLVMHTDELSSTYLSDVYWFGPDTGTNDIAQTVPDNPLFRKYSVVGSKGGMRFMPPGNSTYSCLHFAITAKEDSYISIIYGGGSSNRPEESGDGEPYAFMICDTQGNPRVCRTSCDDGEGNNINSTYKTSIQYTGKIYAGETLYVGHADITNSNPWHLRHTSTGMSLTLYKMVNNSTKLFDNTYNNTIVKQIKYADNGDGTVQQNNKIYNILKNAFDQSVANKCINYKYISLTATKKSYATISALVYDTDCYCVITNGNTIVNSSVITGQGNNATQSKVLHYMLNTNETIHVITATTDFTCYASIALCPVETLNIQ